MTLKKKKSSQPLPIFNSGEKAGNGAGPVSRQAVQLLFHCIFEHCRLNRAKSYHPKLSVLHVIMP